MKKYLAVAFAAIAATIFVANGNAATKDTCPAPFGTNFSCTFQPATVTTTSHTHIVIHSTVTKDVKTYRKITGHVAIIAVKPKGATSLQGCIDPVAAGMIGDNGDFQNSGSNTGFWWTHWKSGWTICGAHKVNIKGFMFWEGRKGNCWNVIRIPIGQAPSHVTVIVDEFRTTTVFYSVYDKVVTKTNGTTFSCTKFPGSTLTIINGKGMCFIAIQIPVINPSPTPGPTFVCTINGVGQTIVPPGYVNVNGICQQQTVNTNCQNGQIKDSNGVCVSQGNQAALNCQQTAQSMGSNTTWSFNNNTLTCTIVQVNANCSNVIVIIGSGSPQVHQEGNCNTTPPPAPAPPKPQVAVDFVEEVDASNGTLTSTRPVCGTVTNVAAGDTVSVTATTDFGTIISQPAAVTIGSNGSARVCAATYLAPTEALTDHVYMQAYDQTTKTSGDKAASNAFAVKVALPPPPRVN